MTSVESISPRRSAAFDLGTAGLIAVIVAAVFFGATSRVTGMRVAFCTTPDELAEVMPGLRLHGLPILNIGSDIRSHFIGSTFYSQHGLGDAGFYYVASLVLDGLGIPISERNLWLFTGATNGLMIGIASWLMWQLTRSKVTAAAAVIIMAVSPFYVFTSQSGWGGRLTFIPLVQALLLLVSWIALRRGESWGLRLTLAVLACVLMLTDGFFFIAVLVAFLVLLQDGSLSTRIRTLLANRVFWAISAGALAGFATGIAMAILAAQHGTRLTLYRHAFLHTGQGGGGVIPSVDVINAWIETFKWYFPEAWYFWIVLAACVLALWRARHSPIAGTLAAWWLLVGATLTSYTAGLTAPGQPALVLGWANGPYHQALPSYLLIAWAAGDLIGRPSTWLRVTGGLLVALVALPLAAQTITGRAAPVESLQAADYSGRRLACEVVKAASYYVRQHGTPRSTVFHLSNDEFLGYFGEFYYGLSYSGNPKTGERNQLLDFGQHVVGRKTTPEEFARAYGLPHFDYYVQFLPDDDDLFAKQAVERLNSAGARPVFEIHDSGSPIGRVWSFERVDAEAMEFSEAARRWNEFATRDGLVQQPIAGTTYHFGYNWTIPK